MLRNARVTAFIDFELLRENQQGVGVGVGVVKTTALQTTVNNFTPPTAYEVYFWYLFFISLYRFKSK